ncbi:hypothetical protein K443DRAFT_105176, partial [Laccaria amethystina LaAM-08-1]
EGRGLQNSLTWGQTAFDSLVDILLWTLPDSVSEWQTYVCVSTYQSPTTHAVPLSQDQARDPPPPASLESTTDDSSLTSAILSRITPLQSRLSFLVSSPSRLTLDWLGPFMNYGCAVSRSRSRLRCYWVAALIKDVVDSCHSDTMYIPKLRWPARALGSVVAFLDCYL